MPTDHQKVLLAVLRARGPAHPADLAWHPILREHYRLLRRFAIEDDLEALVEAGEVVAHVEDIDGAEATVAYNIAGMEREDWALRIQRAKKVFREHRRRKARRERVNQE